MSQNAGATALKMVRKLEATATPAGMPSTNEPCPTCKGRGWLTYDVPYGHPKFGSSEPCVCQKTVLAQEDLVSYGLTRGEYAHMRFETYLPDPVYPKQAKALAYCKARAEAWCAEERRGLLFYSARNAVGVGKTHLAVAMLAHVAANGRSIAFYSMPSFFNALLDSYGNHSTGELMASVLEPDVVLLDDVGAEARTGDMVTRTYYDIIDQRLMNEMATIVTTNLTLPEILKALGPRVHSRIQALCPDTIVLEGADHRIKG